MQLAQQGPDLHCAQYFSRQVCGSQQGSTASQSCQTQTHRVTLGHQHPSTVSHWALSHQHPFSRPLYHTGHSATNSHSAVHCITLGTQPPTAIQLSTVSHWALSHQHSFSCPLYHTGHSATNTHSAVHCITLGTQPPTPIQLSTVSHWALSHQQPFSHPQTSFNNNNKTLYEGKYRCATTTKRINTQWS